MERNLRVRKVQIKTAFTIWRSRLERSLRGREKKYRFSLHLFSLWQMRDFSLHVFFHVTNDRRFLCTFSPTCQTTDVFFVRVLPRDKRSTFSLNVFSHVSNDRRFLCTCSSTWQTTDVFFHETRAKTVLERRENANHGYRLFLLLLTHETRIIKLMRF